jgi:O-methyltransferase
MEILMTDVRSAYEPIAPVSTYAPWRADKAFLDVYNAVRHHTMVDIYRCFELWELARETGKFGGDILEVGAWRGGSGAVLAASCRHHGVNCRVHICDTFKGIVKGGPFDPVYKGGELDDTSEEMVIDLLSELKLNNALVHAGIFPDDTGGEIDSDCIRLCHIDVDVFQGAAEITDWVWPKLPVGGVIVYDDYGFPNCRGVTRFVEEDRHRSDRLVIHNLNGHAISVKVRS